MYELVGFKVAELGGYGGGGGGDGGKGLCRSADVLDALVGEVVAMMVERDLWGWVRR